MVVSHDGLYLAADRRGDHPAFLMVHANGFCKEVWRPVVAEMGEPDYLAFDQRGHGDSDTPDPPLDWWDLGRDVLSVVAASALAPELVGVGHSSGGAALAMAEILSPGTFRRLVLVEPILLPPPLRRQDDHPLALMTDRRRAAFPSADHAWDSYRNRPPFSQWDDRALRAYVDHGFEAHDGDWVLKCSAQTEAEVYRTATVHGAWQRLDEVRCRVDLVFGAVSHGASARFAEELTARFPAAVLRLVADAGHLLVMERPSEMAAILAAA